MIGRPDVTLDLIALVAASGRSDAAASIFEKTLRRETTDREYLRAAESAIAYADHKRAAAAAQAGKYQEARPILETALARTNDPEVKAQLARELAVSPTNIAPSAALDTSGSTEKLEAGVRAANAGQFAEARALFEEVARTTSSPEVKQTAEELLRRTQESEIEARVMVRVQKASTQAQLGDLAGAVKELDAILRDAPHLSETMRASIIKNRDMLKGKLKKP